VLLPASLSALAVTPVVVLGWWLRRTGRSEERPYGHLSIRTCTLLIAAGVYVFVFVDAMAQGTLSAYASARLALWAAPLVTSIAVFPTMVSRFVHRTSRRDYLPW
jgi:hypothetical protein